MILTCTLNGEFAWAMRVNPDHIAPMPHNGFSYQLRSIAS